MPSNIAAQGGEATITRFDITSNYNKNTVDFKSGIIELLLYESLLDSTVRATAIFADTGYGDAKGGSVSESGRKGFFQQTAGEKTELVVVDAFDQKLSFIGDYHLRVRQSSRESFGNSKTTNTIITTDFYSLESITNHYVDNRVVKKYEGKTSDNVKKILKECLKTKKSIDVDMCLNDYNFLGYNEKVFHTCTELCKYSVPDLPGSFGILAGYLFYETADNGRGIVGGYHFKSIDKLFTQKPVRKMIYNNLTSIPLGYDNKILNHYEHTTINLENHVLAGDNSKRQMQTFDPFTNKFKQDDFNFKTQNKIWNNAGTEYLKLATDIGFKDAVTRTSSRIADTGNLPPGKTWEQQKEKSKKINFDIPSITRQAANRINQLFTTQITIIIPCDLGLHVGDLIHCDFPEISAKKVKVVSDNKSGIYMIMDLAHRVTKRGSYTSLHLVRDTTYRKSF